VGGTGSDYSLLAEAVHPVYFAGEATNKDHPATTGGAYLSGLREAAKIAGAFGRQSTVHCPQSMKCLQGWCFLFCLCMGMENTKCPLAFKANPDP